MKFLIWISVSIGVAAMMDLWAGLLHGRVWHSWLWNIHQSHHGMRKRRFELNDWLSMLHAPIAIALILYGCRADESIGREVAFAIGIGMSLFGMAYLVVHDGFVHERLPVDFLGRWSYFVRIRDLHRAHHQNVYRGAPYRLFFAEQEVRAWRKSHAPTADGPRIEARAIVHAQRSDSTGPSERSTSP